MQKSKTSQKGAGKQRTGSEQARSGTSMQKGEGERIQPPKTGEQMKQKQEQARSGSKKTGGSSG